MYKFRRVEISDEDILLDWINDPVTRRMSINSSEIKPEDHNIWFSGILNSNTSAIYIYEKVTKTRINTPVASMRIDKVNNRNYLSWNVSGKMRKKGIGGKMLSDFVKEHKGKYFAKIKVNNPASMAICSKSGFCKYYSKGNMTYWRNF
tara:strand:- start:1129 stop:1572 length:444 start_codon:yes stop_codon:yes gene_type:complete